MCIVCQAKNFTKYQNISEDSQELSLSRSTAFPRHQKEERQGTNKDDVNATCETSGTQTKKNCNRRAALERSVEKTTEELNLA